MPKHTPWIGVCILALTLALLGCSGDGTTLGPDGTPAMGAAPPDTTTSTTPTLAQLSREIFTPNCAGCHSGAGAAAGMSLAKDQIVTDIFKSSTQRPSLKRVDPGNPGKSYLLKKLEGKDISGSQMPKDSPPLSADQLELVRAWISAGAPL